jgi:phosphoglycerate dehydrogenase-like enzyme
MTTFRVGISSLFRNDQGKIAFGDIGLGVLEDDPQIEYAFFETGQREVEPQQLHDFDGVIALGERYSRASLKDNDRLVVIGRFGVGYDNVDVDACTEHGVALFITPSGVRKPVAVSILTLILALSHRVILKDRFSKVGRGAELGPYLGVGVTGKTLGSIGVGNIGRELFRLAAPFGMRFVAHDPYVIEDDAAAMGVRLVDLSTLLRDSDYVCVNCPLTAETRNLIGAAALRQLKPTAFLINTARGGIVDTAALTDVLLQGRIAGAGLDVTEPEPLPAGHPLLNLDNVIVTSHRLAWTDECMLGNGTADMVGMTRAARGIAPDNVVNRQVLTHTRFVEKLKRFSTVAPDVRVDRH